MDVWNICSQKVRHMAPQWHGTAKRSKYTAEELRLLPLPPLDDIDLSVLPSNCIRSFACDGALPLDDKGLREIQNFCVTAEQANALAWLHLRLQDCEPDVPQSLGMFAEQPGNGRGRLTVKNARFLASWMSDWLSKIQTLTTLDLSGCRMEAGAVSELVRADPALKMLLLSNCGIRNDDGVTLVRRLFKNVHLLKLDLSHNPLRGKEIANSICKLINGNTHLDSLDLSFTKFQQPEAKTITAGLGTNRTLRHLGWGGLYVGRHFMEFLRADAALESIDLADCGLTVPNADHLLRILHANGSIRKASFRGNIGLVGNSSGLIGLAKGPLEFLDLSTSFRKFGVPLDFIAHLKNSETMTSLDVSGNALDGVVEILGDALSKNKSLRKLNVARCDINEEGGRILLEGLSANSTLSAVDISGNDISDDVRRRVDGIANMNLSRSLKETQHQARTALRCILLASGYRVPPELVELIVKKMVQTGAGGIASAESLSATTRRQIRKMPWLQWASLRA